MRVTCTDCGKRVASYVYKGRDSEGHNSQPACDSCAGIVKGPKS